MNTNIFNPDNKISPDDFSFLLSKNPEIPEIPENTMHRVKKGFDFLQSYLRQNPDIPVYGINTGFGSLCQVKISEGELQTLQYHLLKSHACGSGEHLSKELIRLMLALKIRGLSYGLSGVHPDTLLRLHLFLKNDWLPVVYAFGSLGASGDLAPLAHLCLPLIGDGKLMVRENIISTQEIYQQHHLAPVTLHPKEGLALLNGTQFMLAHLIWSCLQGHRLLQAANHIACLSGTAFDIRPEPFFPELHEIRPHPGQVRVASWFYEQMKLWSGSGTPKTQVQDPYSFRCIPQVHGASADTLQFASEVAEREINAVTDNPTLFPDKELILSGGNFHGQPLALALDFLALALHEIGNISERRLYLLLSGQRNLPPFLASNPGLESGMMILQYSAASLVSYNKTLTMPSSADSIPSSNGQEDHVSMGANAARKTFQIILNLRTILSLELMAAARAIDMTSSSLPPALQKFHHAYRSVVPFIPHDHLMHTEIQKTEQFLMNYEF